MIALVANVSPLISYQLPKFYQENYPNFIAFITAYFQWLEQPGNAQYYARNYYNIKDIDTTFDQFIIYFKEKYLKNLQFTTETNIRTVIKHSLDIYRSKGTERCATLIFQLAFDETPKFYYPSTDLFRLSDGNWRILNYLELSPNWNINIQLQNKEIQGTFSGATAFIDSIIRRITNGRFEDIAYISAINGEFEVGEQITPTDGSLVITQCPSILGSLVAIQFGETGTGQNYTIGSDITVASLNGVAGLFQVSNTVNQPGFVTAQFVEGGWGYSLNYPTSSLSFVNANGAIGNSIDIYSYYSNGTQSGQGYISANNASNNLTVIPLSGNLQIGNAIYTYANVVGANISSYSTVLLTPNVYISDVTLTIANLQMTTSNLEFGQFFAWQDIITEPLATLNYVEANGSFVIGEFLYTWSGGSQTGNGSILNVNQTNSTAGVLVVSVYSGTMNESNAIYNTANVIGANLTSSNGYTNSTATANFIANSGQIALTTTISNGMFLEGEEIFQYITNEGPLPDFKVGGWGIVESAPNNTTVFVNNIFGKFISTDGPLYTINGVQSGASANVISATMSIGVINVNNSFIAGNNAYCYGSYSTGIVSFAVLSGSNFSIAIANSLIDTANIQVNIDTINNYSSVLMNAHSYGFPSNPNANLSSGSIVSCLNELDLTVGKISNIIVDGEGDSFVSIPFVVIDQPQVSQYWLHNDILWINNASGNFALGETITQADTLAQGKLTNLGNSQFLELQRMSFANDFIPTVNNATQIIGTSSGATANVINVDYDQLNTQVMGRNAIVSPELVIGNSAISNGVVISSGFGFTEGESIPVGSNNASGTAVIGGIGTASGYYVTKGGFLSDQKKLFDGYYWQNFSYQINSGLLLNKYNNMIQDLTHVSGTILFGNYIHNSQDGSSLQANMVSSNIFTSEIPPPPPSTPLVFQPVGTPPANTNIHYLSLAASANCQYVYAGTLTDGIWGSNDYANTWSQLLVANSTAFHFNSLASDSTGKYIVAAALYQQYGSVYTSNNYGVTWSLSFDSNSGISSVCSDITGQYLAAGQAQEYGSVYTSNNYGVSWVQQANSPAALTLGFGQSIASSANGQILIAIQAVSGSTFVSNDYGQSWTTTNFNISGQCCASDATGQYLTVADGAGDISISQDFGVTWNISNNINDSFDALTTDTTSNAMYIAVAGYNEIATSNNRGASYASSGANNAYNWTAIISSYDGSFIVAAAGGIFPASGIYTANVVI